MKAVRTIVFAVAAQSIVALSAFAAAVAPCTPGVAGENVIPVQDSQITYCVSDFGWSDTWLLGKPANSAMNVDMLSGDDALNLSYSGGLIGSGLGWLSPSMDSGTLAPQVVPSKWSVITPVHSTGANSAESVIGDADGLHITLDTSVIGGGVQITMAIKNTSISTLTGFELSDYFNFHPNGSVIPNSQLGTTSMQNGYIVTTGVPGPSFIENGFMCGIRAPDNFEVGPASGPSAVWLDVGNSVFNHNAGPLGPGDNAGSLGWNLGNLAPGATILFAVGKNLDPVLPPVPEPASVWLMGGALAFLGYWRRSGTR